ncbi:MAG: ATP-binding protein [Candidatus Woesearchaeota archaeon]|nr:ATP-binding protein [Candidatus Woesearchaeota archaeon]
MAAVAKVISGDFGRIIAREKSGNSIELGELLVSEKGDLKIILQVYDLIYGSQISQQNLELMSGLELEQSTGLDFMEGPIRNYNLVILKNLVNMNSGRLSISKSLPAFFSDLRRIEDSDFSFLKKPENPLFIGKIRSGSKTLSSDIFLNGREVLKHHVLIPATTGRGKSNLTKCMLWSIASEDYAGVLVLDPHNEYYGRNSFGLKDHPNREKISYFTPKNAPAGCFTLRINLRAVKPSHFQFMYWSDPQQEVLSAYYKSYGKDWIEALLLEKKIDFEFRNETLNVVRRKIAGLLDLRVSEEEPMLDGGLSEKKILCRGIFDREAGSTTIKDIISKIENAGIVIIDTSSFSGDLELLVGSLIASELFARYRHCKAEGESEKAVAVIVLEEALRVIGRNVLERGPNVFSAIAREGRKFGTGLLAITQLPSMIPKEILANINTKIILGIEMQPERQAIIDSASQDLSQDSRSIASLDIGEAIITSNFTKFAMPVKIPNFIEFARESSLNQPEMSFPGLKE